MLTQFRNNWATAYLVQEAFSSHKAYLAAKKNNNSYRMRHRQVHKSTDEDDHMAIDNELGDNNHMAIDDELGDDELGNNWFGDVALDRDDGDEDIDLEYGY